MRKQLTRYSDFIFIGALFGAFAIVGIAVLNQSMISMQGWSTDMSTRDVPLSDFTELADKNAYPPMNNPQFAAPDEVTWLANTSPVIVVEIDEKTRAYPLAVLIYHQIANDTLQGVPIAVTYCALCNSTIVFDRRIAQDTLSFAHSGKVRNSGTVMWDDKTESWWQQFTGKAIMGAYTGQMLKILPSQVVSFGVFKMYHPEGEVLIGDELLPRYDYGTSPLANYDSQTQPSFYEGEVDPRLPAMERVLAAIVNGQPIAYPFGLLAESGVINDMVNGVAVVAVWQPGVVSTVDNFSLADSRDVGMEMLFGRILDGQKLTFYSQDGILYDKETHSKWNILGEAIGGKLKGAQLEKFNCYPHFWFAWAANYPDTVVFTERQSDWK